MGVCREKRIFRIMPQMPQHSDDSTKTEKEGGHYEECLKKIELSLGKLPAVLTPVAMGGLSILSAGSIS
jgi:hypothetical protein